MVYDLEVKIRSLFSKKVQPSLATKINKLSFLKQLKDVNCSLNVAYFLLLVQGFLKNS